MKNSKCIIVDDDGNFAEILSQQILSFPFLSVIGICKTYGEAVFAVRTQKIDFILLDINLEDKDGLNGFDLLQNHIQLPPVIIMSNSPEYAIESYNIGKAKDFIVKPFNNRRLLLAISRALDTNFEHKQILDNSSVFFKMGRRYQKFEIDEIDYFEGYGIYTKVISHGIPHVINESLSTLETSLDSTRFVRVHKSYMINLSKLVGFDHNKIYLKSGSVPIGISYKTKLENLLSLFSDDSLDSE